jgi:hypothetical protein
MALLLRTYDHGRRASNRGFLVSRRAVLRLRLNIIELRTTFATRIALCTGAKSRDVATDLTATASYWTADFGNTHGITPDKRLRYAIVHPSNLWKQNQLLLY